MKNVHNCLVIIPRISTQILSGLNKGSPVLKNQDEMSIWLPIYYRPFNPLHTRPVYNPTQEKQFANNFVPTYTSHIQCSHEKWCTETVIIRVNKGSIVQCTNFSSTSQDHHSKLR